MLTMFLVLGSVASAAEPTHARQTVETQTVETQTAETQTAVMVSPIGPVVAAVSSVAGTPAFDVNLKVHHMMGDRVGWTVQADHLRAHVMDMDATHTALRGGPRFALRGRGLADWTLTPFVSVGHATLSAADEELIRYKLLGGGLDAGRTWVWQRFVMELGLGVYTTVPVAFKTDAEALATQEPVTIFPIKPSITWSVGYAF
jgi:hypothetical protein